ncbi:4Fe-4S dicluster domain-containing protein [Dactylosporangium sp. NPDC000521]|uniref:4Fe-4S dicluster domain-containing protein n=1 Tax=Dactylosporangium sp. NPDC000521 TaxID=3363975 RepID=UPI003688FC4F
MNSLFGPLDPAPDAGYTDAPDRVGFFTDTSICIGCKACEVACKEWNGVPGAGFNLLGMSFDNTGGLTANSWRHVAFIEQPLRHRPVADSAVSATADVLAAATTADTGTTPGVPAAVEPEAAARTTQFLGMPGRDLPGHRPAEERGDLRWLMMSDVCKHCTHAACLDVCPTGALFRTEFGTVVVQEDICNGCGYCIPACPYGVIDQRKEDGRAWKCTLCYDRIGDGLTPACAKACPTESIQYGPLSELRERAGRRVEQLHAAGVPEARLYGDDPGDGVGGDGAFFLLLDEPEVYGLPPDPVVTTRDLPAMWRRAGFAALAMAAAAVAAFAGGRR